MPTLLGHLARFATFTSQSEVLCTQGLAYMLNAHPAASAAFVDQIQGITGEQFTGRFEWRAEDVQEDGSRPDVSGYLAGSPRIKIEAKLDAAFGDGQLESYRAHLNARLEGNDGVLIVLVPANRVGMASSVVAATFTASGEQPWTLPGDPKIVTFVMSWDELLSVLQRVESAELQSELSQFTGMYRELTSTYIAPLADVADLVRWREHERDFVKLTDLATRRLAQGVRLLPLFLEPPDGPPSEIEAKGYTLRYIREPSGEMPPAARAPSYYGIGVRDPFAGRTTPIWLRFHRKTPRFAEIRYRIEASRFARHVVTSAGHIWLPLDIPLESESDAMVESLVKQAEAIARVAFAEP